jgi:Transient receptor potential (TRP) ion channel
MLPPDATSGLSSFAYTVGVRPQDLFGVCLTLFLSIIAGTIVTSLLVWAFDKLISSILRASSPTLQHSRLSGARGSVFITASRDLLDSGGTNGHSDENKSINNGSPLLRVTSRFSGPKTFWKTWWRRTSVNSFHGSVLHGNLLRILILFHLPVTIFSCYQMTLPRSHASLSSIVLAALSFAVFSFLLPVLLVFRVAATRTSKLYEETHTLLSLGPLYSHYRQGSELFASLYFASNFAFGVTIGCGQKSGTAQAVIILVIEVASALITSVWLPWGTGASMGLVSFLFCVARIIIAVLLVILTPTVGSF